MPTYDYICEKGHEFEEFQRITAEPIAECPKCGSKAKRLVGGGAGLIFKGSGFYITDYKKNGNGKSASSPSTSGSSASSESKSSDSTKSSDSGSSKSESKSDKPAAKTA
ncbi:MAG: FmdB family zinc ribbon protein [Candidatus Sumerlaeia bacterium]